MRDVKIEETENLCNTIEYHLYILRRVIQVSKNTVLYP